MIPKIEVSGLGGYTRNVGYKTGSIAYEYETKTFNYDCGIRLLADVMDVEEAGVLDCFVEAGSELQRTQVAPKVGISAFAQIVVGHANVISDTVFDAIADVIRGQNGLAETHTPSETAPAILALVWDVGVKLRAPPLDNRTLEFNYRDGRSTSVPEAAIVKAWEVDPLWLQLCGRTPVGR